MASTIQTTCARQLKLFDVADEPQSPLPSNGSSAFSDPAFTSNKTLPIHRWVPWIAGFASEFARNAIQGFLSSAGTVLDPFSGVGTTLVEATLLGHAAVGFEINPYAALACRTKLCAHRIDVEAFLRKTAEFRAFYESCTSTGYEPKSEPPVGFKTRSAFYGPRVLHKVLVLQDFIDTLHDPDLQSLFRLAFASTMVSYSNYSYEPSLGRRVSAGKAEFVDFPVLQMVLGKLGDMAADINWLQLHLPSCRADAKIINDSFFRYQMYLAPESVDMVVTSPPYLNNYHYNRNTRPQLYWLGYARQAADLRGLEESNFGKYWQTVRELDRLDLDFHLPGSDLEERLHALRAANPEKGIYGGNGWANYAASYFNDCRRFALGIHHVLKPGGAALVVIGNSILQGIEIPTDRYLGQIAESVGLELVRIDIPRATRVGNSIIQSDVRAAKAHKSHQLYEAVVELRKS